ncbi:MAG: HEAT repeat domain-containing protein, partial [Planctomycetes bacterium]|nr:HEAT repeat domain-containing protein [Planctomycetota bacterium]
MARGFTVVLALLAVLSGDAGGAQGADEKARKKAWEEAQAVFTADFRSEDPAVRRAAVMKLAPFSDMGLGRFLVEKVFATERNAGVLDAAITILGMAKQPEDVSFLCGKVLGKGDWQLRAALADALGSLHAPAAADAIRMLLKSEKDPRVLSMALFGAGTKKLADAMDQILPHLEHSDWQVRVAAIEALGELKDERALMPLIDRLMNERGRLREDIAQALKKITGKDFGRDANKWRQWFHERDKMESDPPPQPAKPAEPGGSAVKDEPTYFG